MSVKPISVLLVDDDPDTQNMISLIMENYDCPLDVVDNAEKAVDYLQDHVPDIILLDIYLPDRNGFDTLKLIRQMQYDSKVVAVTAYYTTETEDNMRERGFDGFLQKPLSATQLVPYLHDVLGAV